MARLASLAAARAQPLRPALRPLLLRNAMRRVGLGLAALVLVASLLYVAARQTSLFAVNDVVVRGAPADVRAEVRQELRDASGTSLVALDASGVERRLRQLPSVLDARVDRSFPHTLRVSVTPEQPLAVVKAKGTAWTVSRRGRVIRASEGALQAGLPRITSASAAELSPGEYVGEAETAASLRALALVPADFPVRIRVARSDDAGLTFLLRGAIELRLGSVDDLALKLESAAAVLGSLSRAEQTELGYLDVSLPQRPVAATKSQVSI